MKQLLLQVLHLLIQQWFYYDYVELTKGKTIRLAEFVGS